MINRVFRLIHHWKRVAALREAVSGLGDDDAVLEARCENWHIER